MNEISYIDVKMFFLGILLLIGGTLISYVEFGYPEYFFGWFGLGLAGPLVWGLFIILILFWNRIYIRSFQK